MLHFNGLSEINSLIVSISPMLLAQTSSDSIDTNSIAALSAVFNVISLVFYVAGSFLTWKIFQRINVENAWFVWIPILNIYITLVAGDDDNPVLWTILGFIPCVNIISVIRLIGAWIKFSLIIPKFDLLN